MLYFYIHAFLYSYSYVLYFSHSFTSIHIHVIFSCSRLCYAWFCSFVFMVYFRARENWMHHCVTFMFSSPKSILCFNNSRQCILVWSSCLDEPRVHLKFQDDAMTSITSTINHNFALLNQQVSWHSGMSLAFHQVRASLRAHFHVL